MAYCGGYRYSFKEAEGFNKFSYYQTVFEFPDKINSIEKPHRGFGKGGFVAISAKKEYKKINRVKPFYTFGKFRFRECLAAYLS